MAERHRSPDRRVHMVGQLGKNRIRHEIVDAVDRRDLDLSNTPLFDPVVDSSFRLRAFGCVQSNLDIYQRVLDDGLKITLGLKELRRTARSGRWFD